LQVKRAVTAEEVNALLKEASQTYLEGILGFDEVPKVRAMSYK
jgi:glyceraldehyde 3-phosphate dehydrogenase